MSEAIVLKTFQGGNITPQNDAIIYQTAIPMNGIFKGCEITLAQGNSLHISQGFGMIKGRLFEIFETEILVELTSGEELLGRLHVHLDLSNADAPIVLLTQTGQSLPTLVEDEELNYNDSAYDLELATFRVSALELFDLQIIVSKITPSEYGQIQRGTQYALGDSTFSKSAPGWVTLTCIKAGKTAAKEPIAYSLITTLKDVVIDGTAEFEARNLPFEIETNQEDIVSMHTQMLQMKEELSTKIDAAGNLKFVTCSLEEYAALVLKEENTVYLCYEGVDRSKVKKIYLGESQVYFEGALVTYQMEEDYFQKVLVAKGEDAIERAPLVTKAGYELAGWRVNSNASEITLPTYPIVGEEPVTLYAVFKKKITIGFGANGGVGESVLQESFVYYNNGASVGGSFLVPNTPFTKESLCFAGWSVGVLEGVTYKPNEVTAFLEDTTLYAMWTAREYTFSANSSVEFSIPEDGIYKLETWGAQGGTYQYTTFNPVNGGLGGYSIGYRYLEKGTKVYVCVGGIGEAYNGGYNGGGRPTSVTTLQAEGGGGATHIALVKGTLKEVGFANKDSILLVAGGGGGASAVPKTGNGYAGGTGGGEQGGHAVDSDNGSVLYGGKGGGQISNTTLNTDLFGYGGDSASGYGAGGGGYYGGLAGKSQRGGGGGSGYLGGVPSFTKNGIYYEASSMNGIQTGYGKAKISYETVV